jgi:hypothetical protein
MDALELVNKNMLVKMLAGSHAYGTAIATSDVDYRGLFCADKINIVTPFFPINEAADTNEEDTKFFELRHFMKLCTDCNPNIIELLWTDDSDITFRTPAYDELRSHRAELLSSKIAFTTSGYAIAQLKRIKGHNKWIMNPQPEEPPKQWQFISMVQWFGKEKMMPSDFRISNFIHDYMLVPYSDTLFGIVPMEGWQTINDSGSLNDKFEGSRENLPPPLAFVKFNQEEYKAAKQRHDQYWTWKKNRNEVRSTLEENFGYDTKHAMHLVRLLRMGLESLRDGVVYVKRPDAQELLSIRNGAWTYEEVVKYAEEMDREVREVWYHKTSLPKKPDLKHAANVLMKVQDIVWSK